MQRNVPAPKYINRRFALIEALETRADCITYLADKVPHKTPRSACKFCPYHSDYEWHRQKTEAPADFADSVKVDYALRTSGAVANRDMRQQMYLHRSCKPLDLVQFDTTPPKARSVQLPMNFTAECEGVCGV
jgi:hypothetical protein